jgi:hypothetical protein
MGRKYHLTCCMIGRRWIGNMVTAMEALWTIVETLNPAAYNSVYKINFKIRDGSFCTNEHMTASMTSCCVIVLVPASLHRCAVDSSAAFVYSAQLACPHACPRPSQMVVPVSAYHVCPTQQAHLMGTFRHREDAVNLDVQSGCLMV